MIPGPVNELTTREYAIMFLLSKGLSNKEIAYQTGLSAGTIKTYLNKIGEKCGYHTRLELALAFFDGAFCECNKRGVHISKNIKNPDKLYGLYGTPVPSYD